MYQRVTRRTLLAGALAASSNKITAVARIEAAWLPSFPIGWSDQPAGLGFHIGHGFQCENSWYLPGYWHCGEDWYAMNQDSGGALVYAMQEGQVVFVGSDYPGRVIIIEHAPDLYSMYGHLDPDVVVVEGEKVVGGQRIGTVLARNDGIAPSHLHLETRTFLYTSEVNGSQPRYSFSCGPNCAPGPGYWPMNAPDLPVDLGWRNPMHVLGNWMGSALGQVNTATVVTNEDLPDLEWWSGPPDDSARSVEDISSLEAGTLLRVSAVNSGEQDHTETSAEAYSIWIEVTADSGQSGWVPMLTPSLRETGTDGRPSSVMVASVPVPGSNPPTP